MNLRGTVMSGLRWSFALRLLGQVLSWVATILVIRLLSPGDYGLMALAGVFIAFLSMVLEMGLGAAIVQRRDLNLSDMQAVFGFIFSVSVLICLLLLILAPVIAGIYDEPDLVPILRALSPIFIASSLSVMPQSLLLKNLQYRKIAIVKVVAAIAGSICTLLMALGGMGVWSLVGGFLVLRIVSLAGFNVCHPFLHLPKIKVKGMASVFAFSGQMTASRVLWYFYSGAAATLIVGKVLGTQVLGFYSVGLSLASLPLAKISGILNRVAFPAFSSLQSDPDLAGRHFLKGVRVIFFLTAPVFWGLSSIAPEVVGVFLGDKWSEAIVPLQLIALVVPLRMVGSLMEPAVTGLGRADISLLNNAVAAVLMPVGFFVATLWGLVGVSLVWVVVFPVVYAMNLARTSRVLRISSADVHRQMRKTVVSVLVMYVCIVLLREFRIIDFSLVVNMLVYIAVGAVVYGAMTVAFDRHIVHETIGLAKS